MSDVGRHDERHEPTFAPTTPVEFAPQPPRDDLFEPGGFETPGEPAAFEPSPDPIPAAQPSPPPPFSVQEADSQSPLWTGPPVDLTDPGGPRDNGWLVVTAVLVAVFVAIVVGFTALWDARTNDPANAQVDDAALTRPGDVDSTIIDGAEATVPETTVPETTVPETTVPETTVPQTTTPQTTATTPPPVAWVTTVGPTFQSAFPSEPRVADLPNETRGWTATDANGVRYALRVNGFPAGDEGFTRLGLVGGASEALPPGTPQPTGEVTQSQGGWAFRFDTEFGGTNFAGRSLIVDGRRYVMTVASDDGPPNPADVERFLTGLVVS